MKIHFISGLPRSGSTLLSALLAQNPRFHAGMSSPVQNVVAAAHIALGAGNEFAMRIRNDQRERVLRGLFQNFYGDLSGDQVVFDTHRLWTAQLPLLNGLFPDAKIICCVRNPAHILASFEYLTRRNFQTASRLFNNPNERSTVFSRAEALLQPNRAIGMAMNALKDGYYSEHAGNILMVEYVTLVNQPAKTMELIYQFIGEPPFEHDFQNVAHDGTDFDSTILLDDLHRVRGPVAPQPVKQILPPELVARFSELRFWVKARNPKAAHILARSGNDEPGAGPRSS